MDNLVHLPVSLEPPDGWHSSSMFENEWVRCVPRADVPLHIGEKRALLRVSLVEDFVFQVHEPYPVEAPYPRPEKHVLERGSLSEACREAEYLYCCCRPSR